MPHRRAGVAAATAGAVGLLALLLYVRTLAPTVATVDSGELTVAAKTLGVAHPPGTPLYVLLAHAATWLPFGTVATRVNFASALFAAVAAAVTSLIVFVAIPVNPEAPTSRTTRKGRRRSAPATSSSVAPWMVVAASFLAGLLMAASRTLWAYATLAEVYTLNTMLLATAVFLVVLWRRRTLAAAPATRPPHALLYLAALVLGLALGVHHVTVGLTFPGLGLLVYSTARRRPLDRRTLVVGALCLLAGVSVYLYLPIAASRSPLIDWGDPRTLQRFWWHITGRQYQAFLTFSLQTMASELQGDFRRYLAHEFGPDWLPLAVGLAAVGWAWIWKRDRTLAVSFALVVVADLAYALNYDIPEDKDAYYLPMFLTLAVSAGVGAAALFAWSAGRPRLVRGAVAAIVCAAPVAAFAANLPYDNRRRYYVAHDYVTNILGTIAPQGLLLTSDWEVYSPMLYVRHIEGARPDATVIDVNLLRRSWYYAYLDREYPALMQAVRPQVDAFLVDLRHWEQDPDVYRPGRGAEPAHQHAVLRHDSRAHHRSARRRPTGVRDGGAIGARPRLRRPTGRRPRGAPRSRIPGDDRRGLHPAGHAPSAHARFVRRHAALRTRKRRAREDRARLREHADQSRPVSRSARPSRRSGRGLFGGESARSAGRIVAICHLRFVICDL